MIHFKKARIDDKTIKIGNTTIYIENITYKTVKEEKKEIPEWLMKIFLLMLIIPLIQVKFIGFYIEDKEVIIPFVVLALMSIIGLIIHHKNMMIYLMIINTNDDKQHLIFAKSIILLRFIDDFIDTAVNRVLYINMGNGDYELFREDYALNVAEGNVLKELE